MLAEMFGEERKRGLSRPITGEHLFSIKSCRGQPFHDSSNDNTVKLA